LTRRADRLAGAAVFGLALLLYAALMPLGLAQWDTGEMQTVPYILGIAHPPGFPLYVLLGWAWSHAVPFGEVATRLTLLSALCGAGAAYLAYRAARELEAPPAAALLSGALFALAPLVVQHVTRAGVEPLLALCVGLAVCAGLRFERTGSPRALAAAALAAGLALAVHTLAIWFLPGIAVLLVRPGVTRRAALGAAGAFLIGPLLYAYLPLRSAVVGRLGLDPTVALGFAPGAQAFWDYDHPAGWAGFVRHVSGAQFGASDALGAPFVLAAYPGYLGRWWEILAQPAGALGGALALLGLAMLAARRPRLGLALALVGFLAIPFSLRYGVLQDAAKYYLVAVWAGAVAAAVGARALVELGREPLARRGLAYALGAGLVFAAAQVVGANPGAYGPRYQADGAAIVRGVVAGTPPGAIVIAAWTYSTPLAYAEYVEHSLGGRQVVNDEASRAMVEGWLRAGRPVYVLPYAPSDRILGELRLTAVPGTTPALYRARL
jgi:4-amino-4-deoxy-L-arabinose transferase-like glycosyltransferase